MIRDPIVEEVREVRRQIEAECDNDWNKLIHYYRQVQEKATAPLYRGSPKRLTRATASEQSHSRGPVSTEA
jgi:hypothetical protein